ncbi:3'-5' exonuclease [Reinekea marinisedimentorum]|uniref:DNA-directed DNA polymerase n=1 Tax=Reinekea marinisedimentorum TaxID=230495 RepID=A0A4R3IBM0_9GAMM|nr:3'-5' exonuclease [Reinekea marinisedimentorum]TCS44029.1 DNA polymerase-3 subunit epsilon [Reinekea marinisedimentorum]
MALANSLIVLDFETTGISPDMGDRAIEIGAVKIENGVLTDRFQRLMNPGRRISPFIESYTGITNAMLKSAPGNAEVMAEFCEFIGDSNLLAHNAAFDKRFLDAELSKIKRRYPGNFACSLLVARRVFQSAENHKLGTLINHCNISCDGNFHRALFDAEMTAKLWLSILSTVEREYGLSNISFNEIQKLAKTPKKSIGKFLSSLAATER